MKILTGRMLRGVARGFKVGHLGWVWSGEESYMPLPFMIPNQKSRSRYHKHVNCPKGKLKDLGLNFVYDACNSLVTCL